MLLSFFSFGEDGISTVLKLPITVKTYKLSAKMYIAVWSVCSLTVFEKPPDSTIATAHIHCFLFGFWIETPPIYCTSTLYQLGSLLCFPHWCIFVTNPSFLFGF